MNINFNEFRLKFFIIGMLCTFFLIGLAKKLIPIFKHGLFCALLLVPVAAFAHDVPQMCSFTMSGCIGLVGQCAPKCNAMYGSYCLVGVDTCGEAYPIPAYENGGNTYDGCQIAAGGCMPCAGGCTGSGGDGSCNHSTGQCQSLLPDRDCRTGVCVPCSTECMIGGGGCKDAGVCVQCPSWCMSAGGNCNKNPGVCTERCRPPYVYDFTADICRGVAGSGSGLADGVHYKQAYGIEKRMRFFGRGGYEKR